MCYLVASQTPVTFRLSLALGYFLSSSVLIFFAYILYFIFLRLGVLLDIRVGYFLYYYLIFKLYTHFILLYVDNL